MSSGCHDKDTVDYGEIVSVSGSVGQPEHLYKCVKTKFGMCNVVVMRFVLASFLRVRFSLFMPVGLSKMTNHRIIAVLSHTVDCINVCFCSEC